MSAYILIIPRFYIWALVAIPNKIPFGQLWLLFVAKTVISPKYFPAVFSVLVKPPPTDVTFKTFPLPYTGIDAVEDTGILAPKKFGKLKERLLF